MFHTHWSTWWVLLAEEWLRLGWRSCNSRGRTIQTTRAQKNPSQGPAHMEVGKVSSSLEVGARSIETAIAPNETQKSSLRKPRCARPSRREKWLRDLRRPKFFSVVFVCVPHGSLFVFPPSCRRRIAFCDVTPIRLARMSFGTVLCFRQLCKI